MRRHLNMHVSNISELETFVTVIGNNKKEWDEISNDIKSFR